MTNYLVGGEGNDVLRGGSGVGSLNGGPGDDDIVGWVAAAYSGNPDQVSGGPGDDRIAIREEHEFGQVNVTYQTVVGGVSIDLAAGTATGEGNDTLVDVHQLTGSTHADVIVGSPGDDYLYGWTGSDTIDGLAGDDNVRGDDGNTTLDGGPGNDIVVSGIGDDDLSGGAGDDFLSASLGQDTGDGGPDHDTCYDIEIVTGCEEGARAHP